jgi:hypothetical protein
MRRTCGQAGRQAGSRHRSRVRSQRLFTTLMSAAPHRVRSPHARVVCVWHDQHVKVLVLVDQRICHLHCQREVNVFVHLAVDEQQFADQILRVVLIGSCLVVVLRLSVSTCDDQLPVVGLSPTMKRWSPWIQRCNGQGRVAPACVVSPIIMVTTKAARGATMSWSPHRSRCGHVKKRRHRNQPSPMFLPVNILYNMNDIIIYT